MNESCKICHEENCLSEYKKNVILCKKCNSIYTDLEHSTFPSIISLNSTIKIKMQKKISKIIAEAYVEYLKKNIGLSFENMLDIGAGYGTFVDLLVKNGIKAEGIESDESTVKNSNSNIMSTFFDQNYETDKKFDLISINQCLYYFDNQFEILEKISNMLNNNGKILISTINPESNFRLKNHIWTQGCKVSLGSKIFQNLEKFNLKCQNITAYDDNLYKDFFMHENKQMSNHKFWKNTILYILKQKKMVTMNEDGINNFILLQKVD
tara:strand:+ start:92 stop:889 length:798 start_codon:yes stop_codon:yes gene_type:complete